MMLLRICVDHKDQVSFSGTIHNLIQDPITFTNFQDFIVKTDKFLDACGHPQSSIEKRSMNDKEKKGSPYRYHNVLIRSEKDLQNEKGIAQTFDLHIQTRSRGDWQGRVAELGKPFESFTNILDLLKKMTK